MSCSVCGENMAEVSIPIANLPGSPDQPVAFINNATIFTPLAAGETYLAPENVVELTFNVTFDPAVLMSKFQINANGETALKAKLENVDTLVDLTVIFCIKQNNAFYVLLNNCNAFMKNN